MKKFTFLLINILSLNAFAQKSGADTREFEALVKSELNHASQLKSFEANANTGNYDVGHQTLEFTVNPNNQFINGKVTTVFTAKQPMSTLTFDLDNALTVTSVTRNGNGLTFSQNNNEELVINLGTTLATGQEATVVVQYNGEPGWETGSFITDEHNGQPILTTLSEPYGAKDWWPCKQDLNDKIDGVDVYITAPSQYTAVSNGMQLGTTTSGSSKTTHFQHNYPIPAYLVAIAVTNYTIYTQTYNGTAGSFPIVNYLYPETQANSEAQLGQTLDIMQFYEDTFGQYPFHEEKYGHAQWNIGGGMEHTTVSFMGGFNRELIAHELGHQWFGDKVTCGSWQDIWLNEGFATYLSGLIVEDQDGEGAFNGWKAQKVQNITAYPNGSVYIPASDTLNESRIFSSRLSYNKGSMVLHMLRKKLGDATFYQGIQNYLNDTDLAYAYAKTPDFKAHMEAASGLNLTQFFNDWVYNQGYPMYNVTVTGSGPGNVQVTLNQTQSDVSVSFFEAPVPIRLHGTGGQVLDVVLDNTTNGQSFMVPVGFTLLAAEVNPDFDLISINNNVTLGTTTLFNSTNISLYPNPATDVLKAQLPDGVTISHATFYNTLGQKVLESGSASEWNVSALSAGVHFIKLDTSEGAVQLKFVKE
ncbi:M1 family aminopeptidase [Flavobacterium sp. RHBU_24]|uniref:M1 family aminopeptidase n=1 Tax=Flavobacterium sp. RHBU_24 TaxID=3391185 RepID=UPI0039856370